jgi:hypothetical protein
MMTSACALHKKTAASTGTTRSIAVAAVAACLLGVSQGRHLASDASSDDASGGVCLTTTVPQDGGFVRFWDVELGQTDLSKVSGLPCDGDWETFQKNAQYLKGNMWASAGTVLAKDLMADLALMTGDPDSEVFYCPDGVKWFALRDFAGCALKDGKKWTYRGKTYENEGSSSLQSVKMTLSYVCNKQARRRDVGISYTTVVETSCK